MGWWTQSRQGHSFHTPAAGEPELLWGDGPADLLVDALDTIALEYVREWHRQPTLAELRAGLEFALLGQDDAVAYADRYVAAEVKNRAAAAEAEQNGGGRTADAQ